MHLPALSHLRCAVRMKPTTAMMRYRTWKRQEGDDSTSARLNFISRRSRPGERDDHVWPIHTRPMIEKLVR